MCAFSYVHERPYLLLLIAMDGSKDPKVILFDLNFTLHFRGAIAEVDMLNKFYFLFSVDMSYLNGVL
jgi:hypothetical protein